MDLREFTPHTLLKLEGATKEYRQQVFHKIMKLRLAFGIERAMHAFDIDLPLDKLDLFWRAMCDSVIYEHTDIILDYAAKLRKEWGCDRCSIYPCDPSACAAAAPLKELLAKIGEPEPTVH